LLEAARENRYLWVGMERSAPSSAERLIRVYKN